MKVRNGFVSNSSSSSFILTVPKNTKIPLSKMEEYVGGYKDNCELTDLEKDTLIYALWRGQYYTNDDYPEKRYKSDEPEEHKECTATYDERLKLEKDWKCEGKADWLNEITTPEGCKNCKYFKSEVREPREDDYYELREWHEGLDSSKNDYYEIEIDDNEPPRYMDFDTCCNIRHAENIFNGDKVIKDNE